MTYLWERVPNPHQNPSGDINYYISFVLYAVLGRMAEADTIMRKYGPAVRRVAKAMKPKPSGPVYRGLLLEPPVPVQLPPDPRLTFISWSEQLMVACWFADPKSIMSGYVMEMKPMMEGYIASEPKPPAEVLFYYKWAKDFELAGRRVDLARLALMHPDMGKEGYSQIEWALNTQFEVITANVNRPLHVQPKHRFKCPNTGYLDRALTWPGAFQ